MEIRTAGAPAADAGATAGRGGRAAAADVAIGAAVLAGLVLRVAASRQKILWFDEFLSANLIRHPWGRLLPAIRVEAHPPLYFVLLKGWCALFGDGAFGLKSLSVLAGAAAIAVLADAVRRVRGEAAGIAAAVLVALSTVQIDQSSEAKPYAVLALFLAGLIRAVVRDRERPRPGSLAAMLLAGGAAASTHFYGCLAAGGIALAAALCGSRRERLRGSVLMAAVIALSAVWLVPAFSIPAGAADYIREMWAGTAPGFPLVASTRMALPAWGRPFPPQALRLLAAPGARELAGAAAVLLVAAVGIRGVRAGAEGGRPVRFLAVAGLALWPGFLGLESALAAIGRPVAIIGRNEVVVELGIAVLLAIAVAGWRRPVFAIAALAAVGLWTALPQWRWAARPRALRWEDAIVRRLRATTRPGAHVDIVTLGLARPPLDYFAAGDSRLRFLSFPASQNAHPGWAAHSISPAERAALPGEAARLVADLDAELDRGVPVYLAARADDRNAWLLSALRRDHDVKPVPWGPSWFLEVTRAPVLSAAAPVLRSRPGFPKPFSPAFARARCERPGRNTLCAEAFRGSPDSRA